MLIAGEPDLDKLFAKAKPTNLFVTELLNDGSVYIAKVDAAAVRANAAAGIMCARSAKFLEQYEGGRERKN